MYWDWGDFDGQFHVLELGALWSPVPCAGVGGTLVASSTCWNWGDFDGQLHVLGLGDFDGQFHVLGLGNFDGQFYVLELGGLWNQALHLWSLVAPRPAHRSGLSVKHLVQQL